MDDPNLDGVDDSTATAAVLASCWSTGTAHDVLVMGSADTAK